MEVEQSSKRLAKKDKVTIAELGTILCFIVTWSISLHGIGLRDLVELNRVKDAEHKPIILTGVPRPEPGLSNTDL
jgi:hypothetical protein